MIQIFFCTKNECPNKTTVLSRVNDNGQILTVRSSICIGLIPASLWRPNSSSSNHPCSLTAHTQTPHTSQTHHKTHCTNWRRKQKTNVSFSSSLSRRILSFHDCAPWGLFSDLVQEFFSGFIHRLCFAAHSQLLRERMDPIILAAKLLFGWVQKWYCNSSLRVSFH